MEQNNDTINWCGYEWTCSMEGGRIIHPDYPWYWMSEDMIIQRGETIELRQKNTNNTVEYWDGKKYYPTKACGILRSVESFSYGTFSADIKLPEGYNLWPSFWLSGDKNWPPEIDICEAWSGNNNYFKLFTPQFPYINPSWKTTTNVHFLDDDMSKCDLGSKNISIFKQPKNPTEHFVNYKVEWFPNKITFYVDGKCTRIVYREIAQDLVNNITKPDEGFKMNVIFNVWCEDPDKYKVNMLTPMKIKNFKYTPYE